MDREDWMQPNQTAQAGGRPPQYWPAELVVVYCIEIHGFICRWPPPRTSFPLPDGGCRGLPPPPRHGGGCYAAAARNNFLPFLVREQRLKLPVEQSFRVGIAEPARCGIMWSWLRYPPILTFQVLQACFSCRCHQWPRGKLVGRGAALIVKRDPGRPMEAVAPVDRDAHFTRTCQ